MMGVGVVSSILLGVLLDFCFGDPYWLPHPVVWMGKGISAAEKQLRKWFPETPSGLTAAGVILAVGIPLLSAGISLLVLWLCYRVSFWLWFAVHTFWCYQILAARCLATESKKVYRALQVEDLPLARKQLSWLVGRETQTLSAEEVTKACVETVAENTSDGEIAPLFYLFLGGVPLGFFYKAVNTLDSMVGYRNETYEYFGKAAAKLDDFWNWLPARISAWLMMATGRNTCLLWKSSRKANDWRCNPSRTTTRYFDCEQTAVREQPAVCRIGGRSALVAQSAIGGKL